jgi:hypothetical protein
LGRLKIIEVAYGGLAAERGVIWLRIGFWISMLGVEIRNSLDFLWVFFFTFRGYKYSREVLAVAGVRRCEHGRRQPQE